MITTFKSGYDCSSEGVLYKLKSAQGVLRKVEIESIAVINIGRDKRISKEDSRIMINGGTSLTEDNEWSDKNVDRRQRCV